jgi:hypothetical protein
MKRSHTIAPSRLTNPSKAGPAKVRPAKGGGFLILAARLRYSNPRVTAVAIGPHVSVTTVMAIATNCPVAKAGT